MRITVVFLSLMLLGACSLSIDRNPAPIATMTAPDPPPLAGLPPDEPVRFWGDTPPPGLGAFLAEIAGQRKVSGLDTPPIDLAISGGSDRGAYGAGLISGWTAAGNRPVFHTVTGISTGALSAPLVFLGPAYDRELELIYGGIPADQIFLRRSIFQILPQVSAVDSSPLAARIAEFLDTEMFAEIAREHERGRRLLVQTTHLDAQRPVIWDIGALATVGTERALEVARKALLASASIPGAFPPVVFEVSVGGAAFDELHGDGGVVSESTVLARWQGGLSEDVIGELPRGGTLYVIRNGRIDPEPEQIDYALLDLASRSIDTLIKAQGVGDLSRASEIAEDRGQAFFVTWIEEGFNRPYTTPFEAEYMRALFDYGYRKMVSGQAWSRRLPGSAPP